PDRRCSLQKLMKSPFGWLTWIIIIILVFTLGSQLVSSLVGYQTKPTSEVLALLVGDTKLKEVILVDGEQLVRVTTAAGEKVETAWVGNQVDDIVSILNERQQSGTLESWVAQNPSPGFLSTLL